MMMKTLRSFLAVFLCAVLMMGSFTAGAAIKEEKAFSGGMYLPVHFPDDSVEYYSAKVVDGEIYLSPEDIAAITGYQYDVEDYMAFSKPNEYGAMVSVDVTFAFLKENCKLGNKWVPMNLIFSLFNLFICLVKDAVETGDLKLDPVETDPEITRVLSSLFVFSFVWAFGGHVSSQNRLPFDSCVRDIFVYFPAHQISAGKKIL